MKKAVSTTLIVVGTIMVAPAIVTIILVVFYVLFTVLFSGT